MKNTNTTKAEQLAALAALTPEQLETLAALAAAMTATETADEAPQADKPAPKAPKAPQAPKAVRTGRNPKTGTVYTGEGFVTKTEFKRQMMSDAAWWDVVDLDEGETRAQYFETYWAAMVDAGEAFKVGNKWQTAPWETPQAPKAPQLDPDAWVTYRDANGPHMGKAKNAPADAADVETHATQGKALQAYNAMKADKPAAKAPNADKPAPKGKKAPKAQTAPQTAPQAPQAPADVDELAAARDARNAAIIATIPLTDGKNPTARRDAVTNKLRQLHKAGFRYARLERNKKHQLDGLHIYPGEKGRGRDADFIGCTTKAAQAYRAKADKARADGKPMPKRPERVFIWSPVGGGNLYARGIFGEVTES